MKVSSRYYFLEELMSTSIPGYTYGTADLARSPLSLEDLDLLKQTILFTDDDRLALRQAGEVLGDQVDDVLDLWYGFVGSNAHLLAYFAGEDGEPVGSYLTAVRERFGQWIRDTCEREYDQAWLDYQHEVALRHHSAKKNQTDGVNAAPIVPLRYMVAFVYPITATIRPFLEKKGHTKDQVDRMHEAWFKSVVLHVVLWSQPYTPDSDY